MRKVHMVCGRRLDSSVGCLVVAVYANKKRAQAWCDKMNQASVVLVYFVKTKELQ